MDFNSDIIKGFYCFEGLDGTGTTTQIEKFKKFLTEKNIIVRKDFEPTDSPLGKLCRDCLSGEVKASRGALARLFSADRHNHLYGENGILSFIASDSDSVLLCDRYIFSSLAYQGSDVSFSEVFELNKMYPLPELVFYFDISPEIGLERVNARGQKKDIYETIIYQNQVRDNYEKIWTLYKKSLMKIIKIDASKSIEDIFNQMLQSLREETVIFNLE